jgi:glycosyltransferase involved in cell wall biosynthesis
MNNILYVAGARSFYTKHPIKKMKGVMQGIKENGNTVDFIGGGDITFNKKISTAAGGKGITKIRKKNYFNISVSEIIDTIHDFFLFFIVLKKMIFNSYDIILERSSRLHISTLILSKLLGKYYILEWKDHIIDYDNSLFIKYAKFIEKIKIKFADKIIVESNVLKEEISQITDGRKIQVAYNAVELPDISIESIINKFSSNKKLRVVYAGGFTFYHNMELLVEVAQILSKKNILENVEFLIIGNGPCKQQLINNLSKHGLIDIYTFHDSMPFEQLKEYYLNSHIGILPGSTDIICPIKVMEYMGYGMIPLIPEYMCNKEIIEDNVDGFLFKPFNALSFVESFELLLNNFELSDIAISAHIKAKEKFTWLNTWGKSVEK